MKRLILCAAALALTAPLHAQDRSDTILAETKWNQELGGMWGIEGHCDAPEQVWAFARDFAEMGQITCNGLGKLNWDEDRLSTDTNWSAFAADAPASLLIVPLSQCRNMGENVEHGELAILPLEGNRIAASFAGAEPVALEKCPQ